MRVTDCGINRIFRYEGQRWLCTHCVHEPPEVRAVPIKNGTWDDEAEVTFTEEMLFNAWLQGGDL